MPADFRGHVADVLEEFITAKRAALAPVGAELTPLLDAARQAVGGGKRLRPAFAFWGWRAAGGSRDKTDAIVKAATAIELVHASALVHDDVMDNSATRRGAPAAHREFTRMRREDPRSVESERFGTSAAILLGDMLLSWSDELLASSGFKPKAVARGRVYFDKLRTEVVAGQYLDVLAQTSHSSRASDAMRVLRYKSAKYTVERPLQFGAALAKADAELLTALSSYGIPLGEAFQLRDDVLGVFGETDVTGKPSGDDIREGKRTLLVARAFGKATPGAARRARQERRPDRPRRRRARCGPGRAPGDRSAGGGRDRDRGADHGGARRLEARPDRRRRSPRCPPRPHRPRHPARPLTAELPRRQCWWGSSSGTSVSRGAGAVQQDSERAAAFEVHAVVEDAHRDVEHPPVRPCQRRPAVPEHQDPFAVRVADVGKGVGERVEVVPHPVGELEPFLTGVEEAALVLDLPRVQEHEAPAGPFGRMLHRRHVGGARPVVDPGWGVSGQQPCQSAHGAILTKES